MSNIDPRVLFSNKEFEELTEEEQDFFIEKAHLSFEEYGDYAKTLKNGSVTITPYGQGKLVFNALSTQQQMIFLGTLLATLFSSVINTFDPTDLPEDMLGLLTMIDKVIDPRFLHSTTDTIIQTPEEIN